MRGAWNSVDRWGWIDPVQPVNWGHYFNQAFIGWWLVCPPFAGGTSLVDLGKRYDGQFTNQGGNAWGGERPGKHHFLNWPGADGSYVETPTINHNIGTGNFTWALWARKNVTGQSYSGVVSRAFSPVIHLRMNGGNWGIYWSTERYANTDLTVGQWYHLAIKRTGTTVEFFVDGVKEASSYTISSSVPNGTFLFGSSTTTLWETNAGLDDIRVWNKAFSDTDIADYYELGRRGYPGVLNRLRVPTHYAAAAPPAAGTPYYYNWRRRVA